ncbi:restriction endonuclease subunit S [Nitrosomonas sp. Is37]|uniref:restriction endonuclease subunit S n=1 Tax=Nitrosomonas sp. Is37 TaxID=3080535 RepID=UPI00294B1A9B|nr:restriction endonuclease subunit S [Nitrosomonas sp. Is37]MDV6345295.1 restriction endonuclease subunit S [Nitrosomonas sp. Is37]
MKLPHDWLVARLGDLIIDMQPGFAQAPGEGDSGTGQIRTHNVTPNGELSLTDLKYVYPSEKEAEKYLLQKGDIIFNNTNSEEWVGKTALFDIDEPLLFSNHMTRIRVNTQLMSAEFLARYLHFLWKIGFSRMRAKRWVSQAAVDQRELSTYKVPLPSLPEQQRIVEILKQADALRRQQREILDQAKKLPAALFLEMFGDPITNPFAFKTRPLVKLGDLDRGVSKHRPRDAGFLYGGKYPFIQTGDVANSNGWISNYSQTYSEAGLAQSQLWSIGTLCITIAANIARTGILEFDACFPDSVVGFLAGDEVTSEYMMFAINLWQGVIEAQAPQAAQKNINLKVLRTLRIPVPPIDKQKEFSVCIRELRQTAIKLEEFFDDFGLLESQLRIRAFAGELTQNWREAHRAELQKWLREHADQLPKRITRVKFTEIAPPERAAPGRPARHWLMDQLSTFQAQVYQALEEWKGTLIPAEDLDRFLVQWPIEHLEDAHDQTLRALNQLSGLGLIARVSIPNQHGEYVTAYRMLREDELTKFDDFERLGTPN